MFSIRYCKSLAVGFRYELWIVAVTEHFRCGASSIPKTHRLDTEDLALAPVGELLNRMVFHGTWRKVACW